MKKLMLLGVILIIFFSGCYSPPEPTADMSFILSPDAQVNGRFGRAVAIVGDYAFVGESLLEGSDALGKPVVEGGHIKMFHLVDELWSVVEYANTDPLLGPVGAVKFSSSDCQVGDEFGAELYYAENSDATKKFLFVGAIMVDARGTVNSGAVYVFSIPDDLSRDSMPTELAKICVSDDVAVDHSDVVYGKGGTGDVGYADYFPTDATSKEDEILLSNLAPGQGFGKRIRYDADSEVLVIGAPYESYYKYFETNDSYISIQRPGAVYVFSPNALDYTSWSMDERLMPQWYLPNYNNIKYYKSDGSFLGEEIVEVDGSTLMYEDRSSTYFGKMFDVYGDTIVVGHSSASFLYYYAPGDNSVAPDVDAAGNPEYFSATGVVLPAPTGSIHSFEEKRTSVGAGYVYKNDGSNNWTFTQRLDRQHNSEEFADYRVGDYITDEDFYEYDYRTSDYLGESVIVYKDTIILGMPGWEDDQGRVNGASGIYATYSDVGAIAYFKLDDGVNEFQYPQQIVIGPDKSSTYGCQWGRRMYRRGDVLAINSPGYDYSILQWDVGKVEMYQLDLDGTIVESPIDNGMVYTTKELYKGSQAMGNYMDFNDTHILCGIPDFDLTVYYDKPYIYKYNIAECGALYFFKRQK